MTSRVEHAKRSTAVLCSAVLLSAGCTERNLPVQSNPPVPQFELQDGAHNSGNGHFYFLPPIASLPVTGGTFDPSLQPVVRICQWTDLGCVTPFLVEFTTTTGPGSETVRVDIADEVYVVDWHTGQFSLDATKTYRISVLVSGVELGHADVDIVTNGKDLKSVTAGTFVPLLSGQTLPIKFRIEQGALLAASPAWIQLAPLGGPPATRSGHSAVYDPASSSMIVFGGLRSGIGYVNDLWILSNANGIGGTPSWSEIATPSAIPPGRAYHSAVFDKSSNRMIVFGGYGEPGGPFNDVWVLSNASGVGGTPTWNQLQPLGTPPAVRFYHTAVYDQTNNRMILFAGGNLAGGVTDVFADVWILTNANGLGGTPAWMELTLTGASPGRRVLHTAVYDAAANRMIIFGGMIDDITPANDVWALMNANGAGGTPSWTQLSPLGTSPTARFGHSAVYDESSNRMTIFGGFGDLGTDDQAWLLTSANGASGESPAWTQLDPSGTLPSSRALHSAVYDLVSKRMTVFAGADNLNDTWVLVNAMGNP